MANHGSSSGVLHVLVLVITHRRPAVRRADGSSRGGRKLFSWPGVGSLLVDGVPARHPAVQGCILVIVLFFLFINTLVDIAYASIDPRIRYG